MPTSNVSETNLSVCEQLFELVQTENFKAASKKKQRSRKDRSKFLRFHGLLSDALGSFNSKHQPLTAAQYRKLAAMLPRYIKDIKELRKAGEKQDGFLTVIPKIKDAVVCFAKVMASAPKLKRGERGGGNMTQAVYILADAWEAFPHLKASTSSSIRVKGELQNDYRYGPFSDFVITFMIFAKTGKRLSEIDYLLALPQQIEQQRSIYSSLIHETLAIRNDLKNKQKLARRSKNKLVLWEEDCA